MKEKYIPIGTKKETTKLDLGDVIYIEKELRQLKIVTSGRDFYIYGVKNDLKPFLDERFLHCHRSYIFNMDKITRMAEQTISLETGVKIQLGRESFRKGRKQFFAYLESRKEEELQ